MSKNIEKREDKICDWMVYVICATFNQAPYIVDAMNGFVKQKTNFPYVCVIIDDASTDGEQEVIKDYLKEYFFLDDLSIVRHEETDDYVLTFAQHKTNRNCYFAVYYLKYNHYSIKKAKDSYVKMWRDNAKYIALCEGDDYWIAKEKLQKQVDFMEAHPEHSLCFCAHQNLLPSGESKVTKRYESDLDTCPMEDIILGGGGYMATNTMLYRKSMYEPYTTWAIGCPIGDLPLMLTLAYKGKVGYVSDVMCVYRVSAIGSWSSRQNSVKIRTKHYKAILNMFDEYDKYTEYKYHRVIQKKKKKNMRKHVKSTMVFLMRKILKKFGIKK